MIDQIRHILTELGEDPGRDGLMKTPQRVDGALRYLTSGYRKDADQILNGALFDVAYDEMVIVKNIEVFSLCEHHMLPFFGKCHVAYIPNGKSHRTEQDSTPCGHVCAPTAGSGAVDNPDRGNHQHENRSKRRGRCD